MTQDNPTETSQPMDVQDILKQLEVNEGTFPREAVLQAVEQREAITPELLRILDEASHDIEDIAENSAYFAHIYAMYLLAEFREVRAYPLLTRFFSVPGEIALDATGDIAPGDLNRLLASVSGGDRRLMMELAENESANEYVRDAALRGLVCLVSSGELAREEVIDYYRTFLREHLPREFSILWNCLAWSSVDLYPEEFYDDLKQAYEEGLIEDGVVRLEDLDDALQRGKEEVLGELSNNRRYSLITDTISELEWWACFRSEDRLPSPSRTVASGMQPSLQGLKQKQKDKRKRKLVKASRRKNRR